MCGISGAIGLDRSKILVPRVDRMTLAQVHRGPNARRVQAVDAHAVLGHNRLSIIDLDERSNLPMPSPSGRYLGVYNGELFNYLELRSELKQSVHFRTESDSEVLLAAFETWGEKMLDRCEGMFSFAVWDTEKKELFCARDPFGIKPFHFHLDKDTLYFASEIKALLLAGINAKPRWNTVFDYFANQTYGNESHTFFDQIRSLPPGHKLKWNLSGKIQIDSYCSYLPEKTSSEDEVANRILEITSRALRSDVKVGVNLSGGLDSALLTALSHSHGSRPCAFSQTFEEEMYSESSAIQRNASILQVEVQESVSSFSTIQAKNSFVQWHQDEPFSGVNVIAYAPLYEKASAHGVRVLLDGNGLDELFGGYLKHHLTYLKKSPNRSLAIEVLQRSWPVSKDQALSLLNAQDPSDRSVDLTGGSLCRFLRNPDSIRKPFRFTDPTQLQIEDLTRSKIPRSLRFNDRMSMAYSCELRVPFLDLKLARLALGLPLKKRFKDSRPKGWLRQFASRYLPKSITEAPKITIQSPQTHWMLSKLRPELETIVHSDFYGDLKIFDIDELRKWILDLPNQKIKNSHGLWQLLNFRKWHQMYFEESIQNKEKNLRQMSKPFDQNSTV